MSTTDNEIHLKLISLTFEGNYMFSRDIKDLTPVRGQDEKISDTQGKDFWSPTRQGLLLTNETAQFLFLAV